MIIPARIHKTWKLLYDHGDFERIHQMSKKKESKVSIITIGKAFRTKKCSEQTFDLMNGFYIEKSKKIKKQSKQLIEDDGN